MKLFFLLLILFLVTGCLEYNTWKQRDLSQEGVVELFFERMADSSYEDSYALLSEEYRYNTDLDSFRAQASRAFGEVHGIEYLDTKVVGSIVEYKVKFKIPSVEMVGSFILSQEDDGYKITNPIRG